MMNGKIRSGCVLVLSLLALLAAGGGAAERDYHRLVLLSDPHMPGRNAEMKEKVLTDINSWEDVDGVPVLGDLCNSVCTPEELDAARAYLVRFRAPVHPIVGNHDYIYVMRKGKMDKGDPAERAEKLESFREAFGLPAVRYSRRLGGYLLVFLSADDLESGFNAALSSGSLRWLEGELRAARELPTLVFFHAPLKGTLRTKNAAAERDGFVAQPEGEIRRILAENPQVVLWASGHTHVAPGNSRYAHPVNLYEGRVLNVHNADMDGRSYLSAGQRETTTHDGLWSNSLFLYPDRIVVKTYDHRGGRWLEKLTRTVQVR